MMHEKEIFVVPIPEEPEPIREPEYVSFNLSEMVSLLNKHFPNSGWFIPSRQWAAMYNSYIYKTESTYMGEKRIIFTRTELNAFLLHKCWTEISDEGWSDLPKADQPYFSGAFESARYDFSRQLILPNIPDPPTFDTEVEFEPTPLTTWYMLPTGFTSPFLLSDEEPLASFQGEFAMVSDAEEYATNAAKKIQNIWRNFKARRTLEIYKNSTEKYIETIMKITGTTELKTYADLKAYWQNASNNLENSP